jgi:hypothetical protein
MFTAAAGACRSRGTGGRPSTRGGRRRACPMQARSAGLARGRLKLVQPRFQLRRQWDSVRQPAAVNGLVHVPLRLQLVVPPWQDGGMVVVRDVDLRSRKYVLARTRPLRSRLPRLAGRQQVGRVGALRTRLEHEAACGLQERLKRHADHVLMRCSPWTSMSMTSSPTPLRVLRTRPMRWTSPRGAHQGSARPCLAANRGWSCGAPSSASHELRPWKQLIAASRAAAARLLPLKWPPRAVLAVSSTAAIVGHLKWCGRARRRPL